jgi:hypothetical protein
MSKFSVRWKGRKRTIHRKKERERERERKKQGKKK